jgi:hypothetical protein
MGSSSWSSHAYSHLADERRSSGRDAFVYHAAVADAAIEDRKVHDQMNPKEIVRESRDSEVHPNSNAIAVLFDVTGSMGRAPRILSDNLGKLMSMLLEKGYISDPQIMFGGIGDATVDRAPLQIGQFESGLEMDADLGKLYLEGGGGPFVTESYELAMYFMARHTSIDCFEKRDKKGYLFMIGDEMPYNAVKKDEVKNLIGDNIQSDIPTEEILEELMTRYHVFFLIPDEAGISRPNRGSQIHQRWQQLLSQNVIFIKNLSGICETIAYTIGLVEGSLDPKEALAHVSDIGGDEITARSALQEVSDALRGAVATA